MFEEGFQTNSPISCRDSKFLDPFYRHDVPDPKLQVMKARCLINSKHNCPKSLELHHTDRYNSQVLSPQETLRIQKIAHGRVQHENGAETVGLFGNNLDEEDEDENFEPARPDNPLSAYENLLTSIVDLGRGCNSNSGQNDEGNAEGNAVFEVNFNADHG